MDRETIFEYVCRQCGQGSQLTIEGDSAYCQGCMHTTQLLDDRVLIFETEKTDQSEHFDKLYSGETDQAEYFKKIYGTSSSGVHGQDQGEHTLYNALAKNAKDFAELSGRRVDCDFVGLDILEVACGSGWVTGTLMREPAVSGCRFHAFDISPEGPKMLGRFAVNVPDCNTLELSVQDACDMRFSPGSFDLVLGNSMLHHLDDYARHLTDCFTILKPGGAALFGEPFALGHMIAAAAMKTAAIITGRNVPLINGYYNNTSYKIRNNGDKGALYHLIDKHMFMRESFLKEANRIGFSNVEIRPRHDFEFFRNGWLIDRVFAKLGIQEDVVREEARRIYKISAEMFSESTFTYALPQFMDIIFQK